MAVTIFPCRGCALRRWCDLKDEFKARVAGLGLVGAAFRCYRLDQEIRPGRRIIINQPVAEWSSYAEGREYEVRRKQVTAVITAVYSRYRFTCTVDPGQIASDDLFEEGADPNRFRFRKSQPHTRILGFIEEEPDARVCRNRNVQRDGQCDCRPDAGCACKQEDELMAEASAAVEAAA